jgi:hypothetical protein
MPCKRLDNGHGYVGAIGDQEFHGSGFQGGEVWPMDN